MLTPEALALFKKVGKDRQTFDERGVKTLQDLLNEVVREEAILTEISPEEVKRLNLDNDGKGWLKRTAWSCKLIIRTDTEYLCELYRIYPGREEPVFKKSLFAGVMLGEPNWTLSETAMKAEDPLTVILRGLREEMGLDLSSRHLLTCLNPGEPWIDAHKSSVYDRVITENHTTWYEWRLRERFGDDRIIRRDDQVELHLGWQPYNPISAGNG